MRDVGRYQYTQVGVPRTQVLEHLRLEAKRRGVPFATHIMDLLVDRDDALYGRETNSIWFPRGVQIAPRIPIVEMEHTIIDESRVEENLSAFCGFLEDEDDDAPTVPRMPALGG